MIGTFNFGSIKKLEGVAIKTSFFHIFFFPIAPRKSFYHFGYEPSALSAVPGLLSFKNKIIPLREINRKSMMLAYIRAFLIFNMSVFGCMTAAMVADGDTGPGFYAFIIFVFFLFMLFLTHYVNREKDSDTILLRSIGKKYFDLPVDPRIVRFTGLKNAADEILSKQLQIESWKKAVKKIDSFDLDTQCLLTFRAAISTDSEFKKIGKKVHDSLRQYLSLLKHRGLKGTPFVCCLSAVGTLITFSAFPLSFYNTSLQALEMP